jgi:hypothetical protein
MTKTYLEWIDNQLEYHQTEVARLTIARGVVEEAAAALDIIRHKPEKKIPSLQIAQEKKPKSTVKRVFDGEQWRTKVLKFLAENGPHDSNALIEAFDAGHSKQEKQKIYNTVSKLRLDGILVKSEDGVYSVPVVETQKTGTDG